MTEQNGQIFDQLKKIKLVKLPRVVFKRIVQKNNYDFNMITIFWISLKSKVIGTKK